MCALSPVHACMPSQPCPPRSPNAEVRSPRSSGRIFILVGRQAHVPVQFSSAQCTAQSTSRAVPTPITAPGALTPPSGSRRTLATAATALLRHYLRCSLPVPLSSSPARTYIHKAITLLYTLPRRHSAPDVIATHPGLIAVASLHIEPPLARWQRRHGGDYHLRLLLDGHAPSHPRRCGYPPRLDHLLRCALDSPGAVRGLMRGRRALSFGHGYGQASDTQTRTRVFWPAARHRLALVHARSQTEGLTGVFCTSAGVGVGDIGVEALAPLGIFLLYSR